MTVIAIEEHWTTPDLRQALERLPGDRRDDSLVLNEHGDTLALLEDLDAARLAVMDEQGVDLQVLSVAPPATGPLDPADAVAASHDLNDAAAAAVARRPERFLAMATLPMAEPSAVVAELERAADLGFVGAMVYGRTGDVPLDDPRYDDLFAVAAARGLPVFIHPQIPPRAVREASYSGFDPMTDLALSTFGWGWHLEAAVAALRLIARGTFDRHPDLQIVLGHWGELLLFWVDRIQSLARTAGLDRPVVEYLRSNVVVTTSGMFNPALLRHALTVTSVDRLVFSTDYPFQRPTRADVERFLAEFDSDADREAFTSGNARRVFGLGDDVAR
ncbi:amidohydrolase family protein [Curtobacterium sp. MCBD17_035]|uniref:amidohydrolase family protein n=1 Tax=Curtobacterium sp. MCBD17_035 TaxID=2175673 RepID=UPI000DA959D2|nr:amidohydrolase family protein [Curtobacterium sp. MCBD17_035]WIB68180.1 amidohydrolase family protein [Curtobacterium sp. MCBD17_035]